MVARVRRRRRHRDPRAIAQWRYEQIEPALAAGTREARGRVLDQTARQPVPWPSGVMRPISLATLYRWVAAYRRAGLAALRPKSRQDRGTPRAVLPADLITRAYDLLVADPEMSMTLLIAVLYADPELALKDRGITLTRATLQRRLAALPGYARLQRARRQQRRRGRYVARRPHQIWHLDAKGPVTVRLVSGAELSFHVLSIIDDASRACLAALVAVSPDLCAAVRVFRLAVKRFGLPDLVYADRAAIFDSRAFRSGLAQLGSHRIFVKPRNPAANGKIEAYHRALAAWYTKRLRRQQVVDLAHLQQLLDGVIEVVYQDHHHRQLGCSPRAALAGQVSARQVMATRLDDAFRQERALKAHPTTGEVTIGGVLYLVPGHLRGQRLTFRIDPEPDVPPLVVEPGTERSLALKRAAVRPDDAAAHPPPHRWGHGPLQALYDSWQGQRRPVAEPGFGLPEIYALLAAVAGRDVPRSDHEAARIQRWYRQLGPLPSRPTQAALHQIGRQLGPGRPLDRYLSALAECLTAASTAAPHHPRSKS